MEFRRVTTSDIDRFRPLVEAYWSEIMPQAETVQSRERRDAYFAQRFPLSESTPQVFWGIVCADPVGFVSVSTFEKTATINDFYVVQKQRRRGYGSLLVESARSITDDMGIEMLDLHVRRDNPVALKFWESQGFMIGHYELTQYRDPEKRIGFQGALSSDFSNE